MKYTENYNLYKPDENDLYDVKKRNDNWDIIDEELSKRPTDTGDVGNMKATFTQVSNLANVTSGEKLSVSFGKIAKAITSLISHLADNNNPHSVTKGQVGLENVDNTADADKSVKYAISAGSATKATADANGNNIINTYATISKLNKEFDYVEATDNTGYSYIDVNGNYNRHTIPAGETEKISHVVGCHDDVIAKFYPILTEHTNTLNKIKPIQTVGSITYQVSNGNTELNFDKFGLTDTSYGMYLFCIRGGSSEYRFIGLLQISNAGAPSIDTIVTKNVSASVMDSNSFIGSKYAFKITTNNSFNAIYSVVRIAG